MSDKLKLEDLKIGMKVKVSDLLGIYDTYLLVDGITDINKDEVGILVYIGRTLKAETNEMMKNGAIMLWFDEAEMTGEVFYDE